ncbi:MAG TPA: hypothetical protein VHO47_04810 [Candidatus Babeliales bacterium]|nr:hypothetical protein [Candidatus Babeliales bacterium]
MKSSTNQQSGYILVLTVMIIAIALMLVSRLSYRGSVQVAFDHTMIQREQAKALALGAAQLAISQLSLLDTQSGTAAQREAAGQEKKDPLLEAVKTIIPPLNQWQILNLTKDKEGIDATVQFCIMCENGKFDLHEWFDFEAKKFKNENAPPGQQDGKKNAQALFAAIKKFTKDKDLFEPFEKYMKQRQSKFNDVTELLEIPEFASVFKDAIFYEPPNPEVKDQKRPLYLRDLFTIDSGQPQLLAWFLSDAALAAFNAPRVQANEKKREELLKESLTNFKQIMPLEQLWDKFLQPLYGKEFKNLSKELVPLLNPKFEPNAFSVLCYAKIGAITQKIYAIIGKRKKAEDNPVPFAINKLYWI